MPFEGVELYKRMYRSRRFEEAVAGIWRQGHISAEMHLSVGEEGIAAGVVDQLGDGDALALDHRGTAPLVMRGADLSGLLMEFMGLPGGLCGGMGGHMHLFSAELLSASSGIVGASGPAACGFALSAQQLRPGRVAVAFFGEAAMNQGMLMESINLAAVWALPVIFVCKDNGMGITTPSEEVTAGDLLERARGLGAIATSADGSDVEEVWHVAYEAVQRARRGDGPTFLHTTCVRPEGHFLGDPLLRIVRQPIEELKERVGPLLKASTTAGATVTQRAASLGEVAKILGKASRMRGRSRRDPVANLRRRLPTPAAELSALEREIDAEVTAAAQAALAAFEARS